MNAHVIHLHRNPCNCPRSAHIKCSRNESGRHRTCGLDSFERLGAGDTIVVVYALRHTTICVVATAIHLCTRAAKLSARATITAVAPLCASASVQARKGGLTFVSGGAGGWRRSHRVSGAGGNTVIVVLALGHTAICSVTIAKHPRANSAMLTATALIAAVGPLCASTSVRARKSRVTLGSNGGCIVFSSSSNADKQLHKHKEPHACNRSCSLF